MTREAKNRSLAECTPACSAKSTQTSQKESRDTIGSVHREQIKVSSTPCLSVPLLLSPIALRSLFLFNHDDFLWILVATFLVSCFGDLEVVGGITVVVARRGTLALDSLLGLDVSRRRLTFLQDVSNYVPRTSSSRTLRRLTSSRSSSAFSSSAGRCSSGAGVGSLGTMHNDLSAAVAVSIRSCIWTWRSYKLSGT